MNARVLRAKENTWASHVHSKTSPEGWQQMKNNRKTLASLSLPRSFRPSENVCISADCCEEKRGSVMQDGKCAKGLRFFFFVESLDAGGTVRSGFKRGRK